MRRTLATRLGIGLLISASTFAATRCGAKKDKDDDDKKPTGVGVPADWDGLSDYAASSLEVVEE